MEINKYQLEPSPREITGIGQQDDLFVTVEIGNGQIGGNKVTMKDIVLAKGNLTQPALLGKVSDLTGDEIVVLTNVLDVNAFTNMCIITTTFLNQDNSVLFTKIDKGEAPESGIASFSGHYLIKILTLLIVFFSVPDFFGQAQNLSDGLNFQHLETPASPGFILMDKTPSSIEKPTTPQGFGLSVLGFLQEPGGALEFAPFWLTNHPGLTAKKMADTRFPVLYNLAISVATLIHDDTNSVSGGLRTRLFQMYSGDQHNELDSLRTAIENLLSEDIEGLDIDKIEHLRDQYVEVTEKPVFNIDFAVAAGGVASTNSFDDLQMNRWGAWLAFNWRPKGDDFYCTALTRYIRNDKYNDYGTADLTDLGARFNYDISKFCISLEYLQRLNLTTDEYSDYRIAIIGSYQLSDNFFITSSFGKNFTEINNIIALAGISFGYSTNKIRAF